MSKKSQRVPPFYIFRHYATYRRLHKKIEKIFGKFFPHSGTVEENTWHFEVLLLFLSLRYGAHLGRSQLVDFCFCRCEGSKNWLKGLHVCWFSSLTLKLGEFPYHSSCTFPCWNCLICFYMFLIVASNFSAWLFKFLTDDFMQNISILWWIFIEEFIKHLVADRNRKILQDFTCVSSIFISSWDLVKFAAIFMQSNFSHDVNFIFGHVIFSESFERRRLEPMSGREAKSINQRDIVSNEVERFSVLIAVVEPAVLSNKICDKKLIEFIMYF